MTATISRLAEATTPSHTQAAPASAPQLPVSQCAADAQCGHADGTQLAGSNGPLETHSHCDPAPTLAETKTPMNTHMARVSASNFSDSHFTSATQSASAVAEPISAGGHRTPETHPRNALGGFLRDPVLGVLADVVDDLESVRIANANRVRQLTRTATDKDGEERGFGLTLDHPEVAKLALTVKALESAEHDAILNLKRALRKHPLSVFQKAHKGIGEKQLARLLAVIGDPYWNDLHERPRTVSELWAYCGFHVIKTSGSHGPGDTHTAAAAGIQPHTGGQARLDAQFSPAPGVAPKRQRGQRSNWSEDARKRVWVIAAAMPKFPGGHYEGVYRQAREKYEGGVHSTECVRCGPKGKPAQVGSPRSDGHNHAMAIRITAKEILKDLWIAARDLHEKEQS
ncbi:hypothetical protein [Nocardia wallacei]|uniref:hypothetical protein n=1 Tax=Nocardia wallacei TaxID=480035 RepID=UPI0024554BD3|nr:hypothetical protein [Nocardia wallacei]